MNGMQDKFDADLLANFEVAKKYQGGLQRIKELSREDPEGTARWITEYLPKMMEELREQAAQEWKVDIADLDGLKDAASSRDLLEAKTMLFPQRLLTPRRGECRMGSRGYRRIPPPGVPPSVVTS
jgi:hypothetical protein